MASGRKNYPFLLHTAITFTTGFLGSFGIIGLLRFGKHGVEQIATENLPDGSNLTRGITSLLIFAILFTFPLQMFPVIQCVEKWLLIPKKEKKDDDSRSASIASMDSDFYGDTRNTGDPHGGVQGKDKAYNPLQGDAGDVGTQIVAVSSSSSSRVQVVHGNHSATNVVTLSPFGAYLFKLCGFEMMSDSRSFDAIELYGPVAGICLWKTFLLRTCLILFASFVGLVAVNYFSYIAALVGALGATALSFIIPSVLHLKFFEDEITMFEKVSDVTIACIGVVAAVVGLYTTIKDWIS
jgi:amino acid permease